jgi:hypothetical protein
MHVGRSKCGDTHHPATEVLQGDAQLFQLAHFLVHRFAAGSCLSVKPRQRMSVIFYPLARIALHALVQRPSESLLGNLHESPRRNHGVVIDAA